jgi:hypothetical protein
VTKNEVKTEKANKVEGNIEREQSEQFYLIAVQ